MPGKATNFAVSRTARRACEPSNRWAGASGLSRTYRKPLIGPLAAPRGQPSLFGRRLAGRPSRAHAGRAFEHHPTARAASRGAAFLLPASVVDLGQDRDGEAGPTLGGGRPLAVVHDQPARPRAVAGRDD